MFKLNIYCLDKIDTTFKFKTALTYMDGIMHNSLYAKHDRTQELDEQIEIQELEVNTGVITREEIANALKLLKNGKSAGTDNLPIDLIKADTEQAIDMLHKLLNKIWANEELPQEWKEGLIIKIPKKGDLSNCKNWRAITLLSASSKVLTKILLERMKEELDKKLRSNQAGFRAKHSTIDHICTLRIFLEQANEWQKDINLSFIDFEKAFDRVNREQMWKILRQYGLPTKIINLIKLFYDGYKARLEHEGAITEEIAIESGVKQGCILSPTLFLILVDWIMRKVTDDRTGIRWNLFNQLEDLKFADNVYLLTEHRTHMQTKVDKLTQYSDMIGLRINTEKTNILKNDNSQINKIKIKDKEIEEVEKVTYLGSIMERKGGCMKDIQARITKAQFAFNALNKIWQTSEITESTKINIFNTCVKSILLYGAETWKHDESTTKRLQTFVNRSLRKILKIYWPNIITNEELWK